MAQITTTPEQVTETHPLTRPLLAAAALDWEKIAYLVFFGLAVVTRLWGLGDRVVSHDESLHTQYAYQYYNGDGYQHTPLMHGPFLFHITAVSYWLFGHDDFSARLPVALFGIALVVAPYFWRPWLGRVGALFTSFVFLISPYILYYSRYIRHDIFALSGALFIFTVTWYYLRDRQEKHLWAFAGGLAFLFCTKEVSFIYVAIFGSFLVLRLANRIRLAPWFGQRWRQLLLPLGIVLLAIAMTSGGLLAERAGRSEPAATETATAADQFAADPNEATIASTTASLARNQTFWRWLSISGLMLLGGGLFLAAHRLRPQLDAFAEFDLIILYSTLLLPSVAPLLTKMAGWNPIDYTFAPCLVPGQEAMSDLALALTRLTSPGCWTNFIAQGGFRSGVFLVPTIIAAVLVGLWWHSRRWLTAVIIFQAIFTLLYTSLFTNPQGWFSGTLGSLGYWLEQQEVQRGSQPFFYYFFVVPLYEFVPITFSMLAFRLWARRQGLNKILGYWVTILLTAFFGWSFGNWLWNRPIRAEAFASGTAAQTTILPGIILALLVIAVGGLYYVLIHHRRALADMGTRRSWNGRFDSNVLFDFVPALIWWLLLTVVAYSVAGEKMPWLSTHFVIPMALLTGWYFNARLEGVSRATLLSRQSLTQIGLTTVTIIAAAMALGPLLLGGIRLADQTQFNLIGIGRFFGMAAVTAVLIFLWWRYSARSERPERQRSWLLGVFVLLSLLTIRFAYMANFPNGDYVTEYMVYAHGAPATKSQVMRQIDELSFRLYGDKSMAVAYDDDSSWPMTWYLRDYPNRKYFGKSPSRDIVNSPVIVAGSLNWDKVDPFLGDQYQAFRYTFLWWPMEEYRQISWDALLGLQNGRWPEDPARRRGLLNADLRQGLWDIFFYRDYTKYGQVFNRDYSIGQWPLRRDLRLYVRKDVLANLWDHGLSLTGLQLPEDPYAEGALTLIPIGTIGSGVGSGPGQLLSPRNVAAGPDGRLFVADSGNHRIQVFDADGRYLTSWGEFGSAPGLFNEPWGLAVDDRYVYVADTWNHRIQKFTFDGQFVGQAGALGQVAEGDSGAGLFYGPRDVLVFGNDRLVVTDTGNHRLVLLDLELNFIQSVGSQGVRGGQFNEPVGLASAVDGGFYIADTWNSRIQLLWSNLLPSNEWRVEAWFGDSVNNKPYLATDSAGRVYASDPENYRILIFSPNGEYVARFGQYGTDANSFGLPNGLAIDAAGNLYVADAGNHRILKFAPISFAGPVPPAPEEDPLLQPDSLLEESPGEGDQPVDGAVDDTGETPAEEEAAEPSPTPES